MGRAEEESIDALEDEARRRALDGSDLSLIFLLKHRRPAVYRPPRASAAVLAMSPEDIAAVEQARRMREMSSEEIEAEIAEIERRHALADAARAEVETLPRHRGNSADNH